MVTGDAVATLVRALDDLADCVEERHVHLLNPAGRVVRHVDVHLHHSAERAAIPPREGDGMQSTADSLAYRLDYVRGAAARRDCNGDVPRAPQRFNLPCE